jgi:hypothetical protein
MSDHEKSDSLGKAYVGVGQAILGAIFYFCDCTLVYSHGDHRDITFFKAGIYEGGPLGFIASAGVFVLGLGYAIFFGARYLFCERS